MYFNCEGFDSFAEDHVGHINYYPGHGFPRYFYPYTPEEKEFYLPPLVAIKLDNLDCKFLFN